MSRFIDFIYRMLGLSKRNVREISGQTTERCGQEKEGNASALPPSSTNLSPPITGITEISKTVRSLPPPVYCAPTPAVTFKTSSKLRTVQDYVDLFEKDASTQGGPFHREEDAELLCLLVNHLREKGSFKEEEIANARNRATNILRRRDVHIATTTLYTLRTSADRASLGPEYRALIIEVLTTWTLLPRDIGSTKEELERFP